MFEAIAADANILDLIMAWMVVILVPILGVTLLVEGFKLLHSMLNRYFR